MRALQRHSVMPKVFVRMGGKCLNKQLLLAGTYIFIDFLSIKNIFSFVNKKIDLFFADKNLQAEHINFPQHKQTFIS